MINDIWDMNDILMYTSFKKNKNHAIDKQTIINDIYRIYLRIHPFSSSRQTMLNDIWYIKDTLMYTSFFPQAIDKRWQMIYKWYIKDILMYTIFMSHRTKAKHGKKDAEMI